MGWWRRVREASAAERVTSADRRGASDVAAELTELTSQRNALMRDGLPGTATIVDIRRDVATTALGTWHELILDVRLASGPSYRASRRVAVDLSTSPSIAVGSVVTVRADPRDHSVVLVVTNP